MTRHRPTTIRAACLLMTAALAACGMVDDSDPLPDTSQATVVTRSAGAPMKPSVTGTRSPAPAPAAATPTPAPAPAPAAPVGDAVRGKQLYAAVPGSINACSDCHMSVTMVRRADTTAAGYETMLRNAVQTNLGTMGQFGDKLSDADFRDLAAYLASPGI
jgi:mono/diheme cytochrome c family protein